MALRRLFLCFLLLTPTFLFLYIVLFPSSASIVFFFVHSHFLDSFFFLVEIVLLVPAVKEVSHEIVIHRIEQTKPNKKKFYKEFLCEYCPAKYVYGDGLYKHLKKSHPNRFEESVLKYYEVANNTCDPQIIAAIDQLKSHCLGIFEVLMDEQLSVYFIFQNF